MIYKHRIKRNGIYYESGEDVPESQITKKESQEIGFQEYLKEPNIMMENHDEFSESIGKRGRPRKTD